MNTYYFMYYREQRVYFEIDAETAGEANKLADEELSTLDLDSPSDMSDDPGELVLDGVQPHVT